MKKRITAGFPAFLATVLFIFPTMASPASDVDFSCVSYKVWRKDHLSDRYKDYDITLQNDCPGSVYWAMCIERVDPWSGKIVEEHIPTGYLEADKQSRVNLHLNRNPNESKFRNRFQEFYVNLGYSIDGAASVTCNASRCEAEKRSLREQVRANEAAWKRAEKSLAEQVERDCPDTGWDPATREECAAKAGKSQLTEMKTYPILDQDLRKRWPRSIPKTARSGRAI